MPIGAKTVKTKVHLVRLDLSILLLANKMAYRLLTMR